jgi:hypothetical protein
VTNWEGWENENLPKITAEIVSVNGSDFDETFAIVDEALSLPIYEAETTIHHLRKVMPGLGDWPGFKRCMAIGQFSLDYDGKATCRIDDVSGSVKIPDGRQVEVRLVDRYDGGSFRRVLKGNSDPEMFYYSHCSAYMTSDDPQPNLFVSEGCYHYLHAWIDWAALPPRKQAFPLDPAPLPFGAELYEIVNSKEGLRG